MKKDSQKSIKEELKNLLEISQKFFLSIKSLLRILTNHELTSNSREINPAESNVLDEDEIALIKQHQDSFYQEFVDKVKKGRNLTEEETFNVAQGQILTGRQAKQQKIVDEIGGLYTTVDALADELDIDEPDVVFIRTRPRFKLPFFNAQISSLVKTIFKSYTHLQDSKL